MTNSHLTDANIWQAEQSESLEQKLVQGVQREIDKAEHRKAKSAETRLVAYSDSDSEDELPFQRLNKRTVRGSSEEGDEDHG